MKTTIRSVAFTFFVAICGYSFSQKPQLPIDEETKKVTYKDVVNEAGTPAEMYKRAIAWINLFYPNPADVTRVRDEANAKIEIKHRIKVRNVDKDGNFTTDAALVEYDMRLEFKDGRYRYTITNFNVRKTSKYAMEKWMDKADLEYTPACDNYLKQVDEEVKNIVASLKKGMKPKVVKDDNW